MREKLSKLWESIRDSEAVQAIRTKYDELDSQSKLYVNLGSAGIVVAIVFFSIVGTMARLGGMKSEINTREELIGSLQAASDSIKQLKAQQAANASSGDLTSPLAAFLDGTVNESMVDRAKIEVGAERTGAQDKETIESLVDVKVTKVNLRQLVRLLFTITERGSGRNLVIRDLTVDTKQDPQGYLDATFAVSQFKAK